ncbi:hypothetical protein [Flammeovirga sp. EKP202]|uniref:hypothetical protein n=1 Tax=Flammeovirga sp. EKP202 TaxID=2770592 RepID=UPI00165F8761|nr:hypothetical protein [Flammeovirga sp. EKP202]MBD0403914.1 hypothetical protein [Flammeovirga sp. EKP202]
MIKKYFLLIFFFISTLNINAKNQPNQLLENIPSEGLSFLFYYDAERLAEREYLQDVLASDLKEIFEISKEAVVYTQDIDAYFGLTVRFKLNDGVGFNKIEDIIDQSEFEVSSVKGNFIYIKEVKDKVRFGYVMNGQDYLIVKIFFQKTMIDKKYQEQFQDVLSDYQFDKISYEQFNVLRDSINKLDEKNIAPYFEKLIANDEKAILSDKALKNKTEIPTDINGKPFILYFNEKSFFSLAHIFGYRTSVMDFILKGSHNQMSEMLSDIQKMQWNESTWYGGEFGEKKAEVISVMTSKEESQNIGIDQTLLQYMPEQVTSFMAYGVDMEVMKNQIIDHISYEHEEVLTQMKLGLLLMDDDFMNFFQSGFLAVNVKPENNSEDYNLKMAFRMSNERKGKQFLRLFSQLGYIEKIEEKEENYRITHREFRDKAYLVIEGDIWILGTQSPQELRQKRKKMLKQYPEMGKSKTALVSKIQGDIFGRDSKLGEIYSISEYIDKKTMKNTISIEFNKEIL